MNRIHEFPEVEIWLKRPVSRHQLACRVTGREFHGHQNQGLLYRVRDDKNEYSSESILFTIQASLAAILTTGLTPQAARAATTSCIWPSVDILDTCCDDDDDYQSYHRYCHVHSQLLSNPLPSVPLIWRHLSPVASSISSITTRSQYRDQSYLPRSECRTPFLECLLKPAGFLHSRQAHLEPWQWLEIERVRKCSRQKWHSGQKYTVRHVVVSTPPCEPRQRGYL